MAKLAGSDLDLVDGLQRRAFGYFLDWTRAATGLVQDCTRPGAPASIAAIGFGLGAYPVGVERGFLTRSEAASRVRTTLRFFWNSPHGPEVDATGYQGFYYHFLDMDTGRRAWRCELSTIDTVILLAGALVAAAYFDRDDAEEAEVRDLADAMYRRVNWRWAQDGELTVTHGWTPEAGFLPHRWRGYDEATILYFLALGSPTHPVGPESYAAYTASYAFKEVYGHEYLYAVSPPPSTRASSRASRAEPGSSSRNETASVVVAPSATTAKVPSTSELLCACASCAATCMASTAPIVASHRRDRMGPRIG